MSEKKMIFVVDGHRLVELPILSKSMHRDRARVFRDRLRWNVEVNADGYEVDAYDSLNPVYIAATRGDGTHLGSLRLLPTLGRTMLKDHFAEVFPNTTVSSIGIVECTRLCVPESDASHMTTRRLLRAAAEFGAAFGLEAAVGVFNPPMLELFLRLDWLPTITMGEYRNETLTLGRFAFRQGMSSTKLAKATSTKTLMLSNDCWASGSGL